MSSYLRFHLPDLSYPHLSLELLLAFLLLPHVLYSLLPTQ